MCVVKVVGLSNEGINGRKGTKYPISDQVIDIAVMAGVYAVIAILEAVLGVWRAKRREKGREGSSRSGMSPVIGQEETEFVRKYPTAA